MSQTSSAALHILRARCVITMACVRHVSSDVSSRAKLILLFLVVIFSINHLILTRHLFTPFTFHLYKLNRFKETQILINQTFHANMHKITIPTNYDINNIIFQAPVCEEKKLADGKPLVYWRVPIKTKLSNGTEGDLLILFDESPCFGISNQYGYSMGISMFNRDGPTTHQKATVDLFNDIAEKAKDFLLENKGVLKRAALKRDQMEDIGVVKYPKIKDGPEAGLPDFTKSPNINVKIPSMSKDKEGNEFVNEAGEPQPKMLATFMSMDEEDETGVQLDVDPYQFIGKVPCQVRPLVKVESIFIGQGQVYKIQLKLRECEIKATKAGISSFLRQLRVEQKSGMGSAGSFGHSIAPAVPNKAVINMNGTIINKAEDDEEEDLGSPVASDNDAGEEVDSAPEEVAPEPEPVVATPAKGGRRGAKK